MHIHEFLKKDVCAIYGKMSVVNITRLCDDKNLSDINNIRDIRNLYVHDLANVEDLVGVLEHTDVSVIQDYLVYFNVPCTFEEIFGKYSKTLTMLRSLCNSKEV